MNTLTKAYFRFLQKSSICRTKGFSHLSRGWRYVFFGIHKDYSWKVFFQLFILGSRKGWFSFWQSLKRSLEIMSSLCRKLHSLRGGISLETNHVFRTVGVYIRTGQFHFQFIHNGLYVNPTDSILEQYLVLVTQSPLSHADLIESLMHSQRVWSISVLYNACVWTLSRALYSV